MSDWNPSLYLHFSAERSRPAVELLARVPLENVEYVADLGCGPGNSTALLQQRWPAARITGIDSSPAMIAEARSALPDCPVRGSRHPQLATGTGTRSDFC